ncbi:hypothetical protein H4W33_006383 [Kibdelosporangium phytohabitans]|nr:hypothetical protein [Kibdelosporangium phytohabitans]
MIELLYPIILIVGFTAIAVMLRFLERNKN